MLKAVVHLISSWSHCSQILTGFLLLEKRGLFTVELKENKDLQRRTNNLAAVLVEYNNLRIVYDLMDGYQNLSGMNCLLDECDIYFKRSFSANMNSRLFSSSQIQKIHPLGMNYSVYTKNNPYCFNKEVCRSVLRCLIGDRLNPYFTPDRFEALPAYKSNNIRILFMARLWDMALDNAEEINNKRIQIIRLLKKEYGDFFVGGVRLSKLALKYAPDVVLPKVLTTRKRYLAVMKDADICIGTLGLHQSTGWKTAEYVAASKGIVNERLIYSNPGSFTENINYLSFDNAEECCLQVEKLFSDPNKLFAMKKANYDYYRKYLRPDLLVLNTLSCSNRNEEATIFN